MHRAIVRKRFGDSIYRLRYKFSISSHTLGKILGVHRSSVANWEHGRCVMSKECYDRLVSQFPEAKDDEYQEIIFLEKKSAGRPKGITGAKPKAKKAPSPPTNPRVMTRTAKENHMECAKEEEEMAEPQLMLLPDEPSPSKNITAPATEKWLDAVAAQLATSKNDRQLLIQALRNAGATDAAILALLHRVLP